MIAAAIGLCYQVLDAGIGDRKRFPAEEAPPSLHEKQSCQRSIGHLDCKVQSLRMFERRMAAGSAANGRFLRADGLAAREAHLTADVSIASTERLWLP